MPRNNAVEIKDVDSSAVRYIRYEPAQETLILQWRSNDTLYAYPGVDNIDFVTFYLSGQDQSIGWGRAANEFKEQYSKNAVARALHIVAKFDHRQMIAFMGGFNALQGT